MHTLTRFALTLAQLLVWGYMFGACVLTANAQAQKCSLEDKNCIGGEYTSDEARRIAANAA
jgi:hypothetical protein